MSENMYTYTKVSIASIGRDPAYQRHTRESFVKQINAGYKHYLDDPPLIGKRTNGSLWCIDGCHRLDAAAMRGETHIWCKVINSTGQAMEARLFIECNKARRNVTFNDKWNANVAAGDPVITEVDKLIRESQITVRAKSAAVKAYEFGTLGVALDVIRKAWKGESEAGQGLTVLGVATFFKKYPGAKRDRVIDRLAKVGIAGVLKKADPKRMSSATRSDEFAECIRAVYNYNLTTNAL